MELDADRYSRQLAELGFSSMKSLMSKKVLIIGLNGLGIETAKNLILSGPKEVAIHDDRPVTYLDLGSCYCYSEADINKPRSQAAVYHLKLLNTYVDIYSQPGELSSSFIEKFNVVFLTGVSLDLKLRISSICRNKIPNIALLICENHGAACMGFSDFGSSFICEDPTGIPPEIIDIISITQEEKALVTCNRSHGLEDGDFVKFSEIEGMHELNSISTVKIQYEDIYSFKIIDTRSFGEFLPIGKVQKVLVPKELHFESFHNSNNNPIITFFSPESRKSCNVPHLHFGFRAIEEFFSKSGRYPELLNDLDSDECYQIAVDLNSAAREKGLYSTENISKEIIEKIAKYCNVQVSSITTVIGGIMAQEIIKHTGKYTPLNQFLYIDFFELLGSDPSIEENKYKSQLLFFGRKNHEAQRKLTIFQIGAGAVGCELLKIFALNGVKKVIVTDDDGIENSNLSRQFLFRVEDIGKNKSITAGKAAMNINSDVEIEALTLRANKETEKIFNNLFWKSVDIVMLAVDNIEARSYVDSQCILYEKLLFECGTEGIRGSTHVFIPHKTISYTDIRQPPKKEFAVCTLKFFPYESMHCIEWSRSLFEELFTLSVNETKKYLADKDTYIKSVAALPSNRAIEKLQTLEILLKILSAENGIQIAYECFNLFEELFNDRIIDVLIQFPPDSQMDGKKFWRKPKKIPSPITIDLEEPTCFLFVTATYKLLCDVLGSTSNSDLREVFRTYIKKTRIQTRVSEVAEESNYRQTDSDLIMLNSRLESIASLSKNCRDCNLNLLSFDKDINLHVDFITAASNIRCKNYKIQESTWFEAKVKAGNIVSALSTTTCVSSGCISIEIYRSLTTSDYKDYRETYFILSEPYINRHVPDEVNQMEAIDENEIYMPAIFTKWEKVIINGPITIGQMVEELKIKLHGDLKFFFCGGFGFDLRFDFNEIKELLIEDYLKKTIDITGNEFALILPTLYDLQTNKILKTPPIKYWFR